MPAIICGAGGYGEVYSHYMRDIGISIAGFLDDDPHKHGKYISGTPVLGAISKLNEMQSLSRFDVYAPIGNNPKRRQILESARQLGFSTPRFIHPDSTIHSSVKIGEGTYVLPGSIIMPTSVLEDFVMLSVATRVAHHTRIGRGVFLSTGASVGAGITVEEDVYFGMSATAVTGKCRTIGKGAMIGSCSNVLSDVAAGSTMVGNPARPLER